MSSSFRDYSTVVLKSSAKEQKSSSGAEVKGKLKLSWPPEKKSTGTGSAQQTNVKNNTSEIKRASTNSPSLTNNNRSKTDHSGEAKDKVKTLVNSFLSGDRKQFKTAHPNSAAEKFPSQGPKLRSDSSSPSTKRGTTVTNYKKDQTEAAPTSKFNNNLTFNALDDNTNKAKRFVHFAQNNDVGQRSLSSKLTTEGKTKEQTEQMKHLKPKHLRDFSDNNNYNNSNNLSVEVSKGRRQSEVQTEVPEKKSQEQTTNILSQKSDGKVESSKEILQTDIMVRDGGVEKVVNAADAQSFSDTTKEAVNHQEPCETLHPIPKDSVKPKIPTALHRPAEKMNGEDNSSTSNINQPKKVDSASVQENGVNQRNSLKGSAYPAEKTNAKIGARSTGKSALLKLFTSGGNDKTNKTDPKDAKKPEVKPGGGLLGRLLSSSERDTTKSATQDGKSNKTQTDNSKTGEVEEATTKELPQEDSESLVPPQEQETGKKMVENSEVPPQKKETIEEMVEKSKMSSLKQGAGQETAEMSQVPPQEQETKNQKVEKPQIPPQEQRAGQRTVEMSQVSSQEQETREQMMETSQVPSWEQGTGQQTVEKSQVPPQEQEAIEQTVEKVSSPEQGAGQQAAEMSQASSQEQDTRKQTLEKCQIPPEEQEPEERMVKKYQAPSWEQGTGEKMVEKSQGPSQEQETSKQTAENPQVPPQKQEAEERTVDTFQEPFQEQGYVEQKSYSAESKTLNSDESKADASDILNAPTSGTLDEQSAVAQADVNDQGSDLTFIQTVVTDQADTVPAVTQEPMESINQGGPDVLDAKFDEDTFEGSETSVSLDLPANQMRHDEFAQKTDELLDAPALEGGELFSEALFDPNHKSLDGSSNILDPLDSQETPADIFSSSFSGTALSETSAGDAFDLLGSQASGNEATVGMMDDLIAPVSAPSSQDTAQSSNPFDTNSQTGEHGLDFDIFSSNDILFAQSPHANMSDNREAGAPINQASAFTDDIFGDAFSSSQDVSTVAPSTAGTSNSLNDLFGPDVSFGAAPPAQTDPFADDFFGSAPQLLPASDSSDVNLFADSLVVSGNNNSTEKAAVNTVSSNSWMDDLLG